MMNTPKYNSIGIIIFKRIIDVSARWKLFPSATWHQMLSEKNEMYDTLSLLTPVQYPIPPVAELSGRFLIDDGVMSFAQELQRHPSKI